MAIPSRQIGWSGRANLLWQISKQLQHLTCVTAGGCGTTTTTTTIATCDRWIYDISLIDPSTIVTLEYTECEVYIPTIQTLPAEFQPSVFCSSTVPIVSLGTLILDGPCL
jgi:hypothetical protein